MAVKWSIFGLISKSLLKRRTIDRRLHFGSRSWYRLARLLGFFRADSSET